jgi:phosphoribosyl-ATP pyrophosphohydrolase/phosphoribosyl-AMP cyclohydrolase
VDGVYADCDRDTLLVQAHQDGVACHTGARSCFFTRLEGGAAPRASGAGPAMLEVLERVLQSRKVERPSGSYVAGLFERGEAQICRKIGEEATEVVTAALGGEGDERLVSEVADLWFHTMVLLASRGIPLRRVFEELARRHEERKAGA